MTVDDIAAQLKNARAQYKLRVILADESKTTVSMPKGRNRFHAGAKIVDDLAWVEIHILDAHGALCAQPIKRDMTAPASGLEDLGALAGGEAKGAALVAQITQVVTMAVTTAVRSTHEMATKGAYELIAKLRSTYASELKDVLAAHKDIAQLALERSAYFEDRLAEMEDERRAEIEARLKRTKPKNGETTEDFRERLLTEGLSHFFRGRGAKKEKAPNGESTEGAKSDDDAGEAGDETASGGD
jgi:hypothetical protein